MDFAKLIIFVWWVIWYSVVLDKYALIIQQYIKYIPEFVWPNGLVLLMNVLFFTIVYFIALFWRKELKSSISVWINSLVPVFYAWIIAYNMFSLLTTPFSNPKTMNYIYILAIMGLFAYEYYMKHTKPEKFSADLWVLPTYWETDLKNNDSKNNDLRNGENTSNYWDKEEKDWGWMSDFFSWFKFWEDSNESKNNGNQSTKTNSYNDDLEDEDELSNSTKSISSWDDEDEKSDIEKENDKSSFDDSENEKEDSEDIRDEEDIWWQGSLLFSNKIFIEDILIKKFNK